MPKPILRGDLYYADLNPVVGSEQGGVRPVLIIQNDIGNQYSPTVVVAAVTGKTEKHFLPIHIEIPTDGLLKTQSVVLLEQIRTIDKSRLRQHLGQLDDEVMKEIDRALSVSIGLSGRD